MSFEHPFPGSVAKVAWLRQIPRPSVVARATGGASDGEVEDYQVTLVAGQDFGNAPDASIGAQYHFPTTIAENVRIGNKDATDDEVLAALDQAGLPLDPLREVGERGATLSGGEARRLALSRLFAGSYDVLVLDEPSEHLDAPTADALLDDLWSGIGTRPLLVVTHDERVVARCDKVVRLTA